MPQEEQPNNLSTTSGECMHEMLLYAYEHLNEFKLILCHSEETRFSKLIDEMVEIETKATHDYLEVSEDSMIVNDAINRMDEVLNESPLPESKSINALTANVPMDNSITLEHVTYSYDGNKNALNDISLSIQSGQTVALVGASGSDTGGSWQSIKSGAVHGYYRKAARRSRYGCRYEWCIFIRRGAAEGSHCPCCFEKCSDPDP